MNKVYILLADGFEEIEAVTIIDILRRATIGVEILAINDLQVTGARGITIHADEIFNYYTAKDYDGIAFAGGMENAKELSENNDIIQLINDYYIEKKLVSAICASPAVVLSRAGILGGKRVTCYPADGLIAMLNSAEYVDAPVVVDGNIITSQSPATAMEFALEVAKYLGEDSDRIALDLLGK